jgi:predicted metal-binding membrane protein
LLVLAAGAWALLLWQAGHNMGGMGLTMGLTAPLFVALWVVMMVATMFPAAAPMILMFARVHAGKRCSSVRRSRCRAAASPVSPRSGLHRQGPSGSRRE